jgi:hypothetical protein
MTKKITIEVSDEAHEELVKIQETKKKELKAKVPIAVIAAEVIEDSVVKKSSNVS